MTIAQSVPIRPTRLARWRLRSRTCAVADVLGTVAAVSLYLVAGTDSVVSWPSNRVLLSDGDLSRVAAVLLAPWWAWLIASAGMIGGRNRPGLNRRGRRRTPGLMRSPADTPPPPTLVLRWPAWALAGLAAGAVVALIVIAGGFAVGAAKGSVHVLPGPRYQVSTLDLNQANWTTVTASQFQLWQARFVREDGLFMFFGLIATVAFIGLLRLRRQPLL